MRSAPFRFQTRRSVSMAMNGMVAASQPLAAMAGLRMLLQGGNAVDAAVATAAALNVVEPTSTGAGGDAFALTYVGKTSEVTALNASGRAPKAQTLDEMRRRGHRVMPTHGALTVTAPGAVAGWADILKRHGSMTLADVLQPAIELAGQGFPVTEVIAGHWSSLERRADQFPALAQTYLIDGHAPRPGEVFKNPALARTLRAIAEGGPDAFYRGPIAESIVKAIQENGGLMTLDDMAAHASTWDEPIRTDYRGVTIVECPPNGQGIVALEALNILEGFDLAAMGYGTPAYYHHLIEATKLAFADAFAYVGDPRMARMPIEGLIDKAYAAGRRQSIDPARAASTPVPGKPQGGTVYLSVIDKERNACSLINSNYSGFGSGLAAEGVALQNRGALFSLEEGHPNCIAPGKRPYHTIIPALALERDKLWMSFGVMGGFVQPQGHVQVACNTIDFGMNPQQALDALRFVWHDGALVDVEDGIGEDVRSALAKIGHDLMPRDDPRRTYGGGQIVAIDEDSGALLGGTEPRKDGVAIGY
ncbi:MAG TPA: gamma-glutamyltransferase [Anaerolineae bacterium]|nr:gamma-glutamyltransferase [Anaerolineae bacterium]